MSINCVSCKQRKKEENFSAKALQSESPTCASCDVKMLMKRIEDSRVNINSIKAQQSAVIGVTKKVAEVTKPKPTKLSPHQRLKGILLASN